MSEASKQCHFDTIKIKKIIIIEPSGLDGTDRFVRFDGQTVGSTNLISIQPISRPIDWTGPESWLADPVRFLKPCINAYYSIYNISNFGYTS